MEQTLQNTDKISSNMEFYYFMKVMKTHSDSENILSEPEINEKMKLTIEEELGIQIKSIDRRKIYTFVKTMQQLGYDISTYQDNKQGYYLKSREFGLKELKILVESILANKFITKKQTKDIINKLCKLSSEYDANRLTRRYYLDNRSKSQNNEVIDNIYKINEALEEEQKIKFEYHTYTWDKRLVPRKDKKGRAEIYKANPIGVTIKNGRYYVVLSICKSDKVSIKNYRVDRMKKVAILDEEIDDLLDKEEYKQHLVYDKNKKKSVFDMALYDKRNFKMYNGGKYEEVVVRIKESAINLFIDEIGVEDIHIEKLDINDDNRIYEVTFEANISAGLKKWILSLGNEARVIAPESLKEDIIKESKCIIDLYRIEEQ